MEQTFAWDLPPAMGEEAVLDPYANTPVSAQLPEDVAKKRALKTKIAFTGDETAPSYDEILSEITTQREDRLKDRLAQTEAVNKQKLKQEIIRETIDKGDTSPDTVAFLQGLSLEDIVDKDGIIEKKYAEWRINMGLSSDDSGTVQKAIEADPEKVNEAVDASTDRLYRKERVQAVYEEMDALYQQTGLGRTLIDFTTSIIPWADAYEASNLTPDNVNQSGVLPSNVRRSQIRDMMAMPKAEFDVTLAQMRQEAIDAGDYAPFLKFLSDLREYSVYNGQVDNAFAILSLVDLAPGGLTFDLAKGAVSLGKGGGRAIAVSEARRRAREAIEGVAKEGGSSPAVKAAGEAPNPSSAGTAQKMAEEANAAAGKGTTTVTVDGQSSTVGEALTPKEVTLAAVAEKASGNPKTLEELSKEIQDSYTIDGQVRPMRPGLMDEYNAALFAREVADRKPGELITSFTGDKYKITEVNNEGMSRISIHGRASLGMIQISKGLVDGIYPIYINTEKLADTFARKAWTSGNFPGMPSLPADTFTSLEEWKTFAVKHEINHIEGEDFITRMVGREKATQKDVEQLEAWVNFNTLVQMGKTEIVKKAYPQFFRKKIAFKDVSGKPKIVFKDIDPPVQPADPAVVPAPPKVSDVVPNTVQGSGVPYSRTNLPNKAGPIGWKDIPTGKGVVPDPKPVPDYINVPVIEQKWRDINKTISSIENEIKNPKKGFAVDIRRVKELQARLKEAHKERRALLRVIDSKPFKEAKANPVKADVNHVTVDVPNPATGGKAQVQVPATDANLTQIYLANTEAHAFGDSLDMADTMAAHGNLEEAAFAQAAARTAKKDLKQTIKEASKELADKLPTIYDISGVIVGKPLHNDLKKIANSLTQKYQSVINKQLEIQQALVKAFESSMDIGALRWSDEVFEAVKSAAKKQMDRYIATPSDAVLDVKYLREWETTGRTNEIVYTIGKPDGTTFEAIDQAVVYAQDYYGLAPGAYSITSISPKSFTLRVAKVIDETDPDILKHMIQTDTKTPMSWTGAFLPYFKGSAGVSSEMLQKNLAISTHHAKALHDAFMVAANDIGTLSKKELRNLEALMEVKRDVEKTVIDPMTGRAEEVRGEWFNNAEELAQTYKRAFNEYPSDNVISAYFTMRQMYDFDLLHRNLKLYTEKTRIGIENAKLFIPVPDDRNPGMVKWVKQQKGIEGKFVDDLPTGTHDVLILNPDTAQANLVNTGKSGLEGIKQLQAEGYRLIQLANPDQRPLKMVNDNYIQFVLAKDVERSPLTVNQLPATEGGHIRYNEGFFVKQPRFETTSNGDRLYLGDRSILGASSEAEAARHAGNLEKARQLLVAGDYQGLTAHLKATLPYTVGEFEQLFAAKLGPKGEILEEPALDKNTPIAWVMDGQGTNDAAKTHASHLRDSFIGIRDTIDDPTNLYGVIGKKFTGEKDFTLKKIVAGDNGKLFKLDRARTISPLKTLESAWAEISRSIATDNMKIQAATNWVEEAAQALETPLEELRRNPWAALNNPQWNRQYGDIARIRTLDTQRRQIVNFLGQRDQLGSKLDWMRNKLLNSVYNKKGQAAADWVDDHILPNVRNPLAFARSFAFHTKLGFFNPVQLFLQANSMLNTWAISGNPARVGSALSGVMLMQMSRVNRTPEVLKSLAAHSEKLGWKPGEWLEMDELFHRLSLHIVEGEVGTLDIMTNPKMFKGVGGMFLDKGLVFFREGERAVRMNAWAVAFKEFRDKFPEKVLNNSDINSILRRQEILSGNMSRGSSALWQKGLTGPMTQFWGYQARIMEQLLGKQLTMAEKLRLGSTFAAMYGIPVSLSATTMFQIPSWSTDDIRQYALENGIDVNSGLAGAAMNGIPSELIRWMTSDENGQNGLQLAIGDRYGPGGLPVIRHLFEAKDGVADALVDLVFGASGSITRDFFKQVMPDNWDILEAATNTPNMTMNDFAGMFSTISTVSNTTKLIWALQTHSAMTKDGMNLGDKSPLSAWITFTTGLDEQRFKDSFLKSDSLKDLKAANDELGKEYLKQMRKAKLLAAGSEERKIAVKKANALIQHLSPNDKKRLLKMVIRGSEDFETSIGRRFDKEFKN